MVTRRGATLSLGAAIALLAVTGSASAATLTLQGPDAPGQGYTLSGNGYAAGSWIWIDVNDLTDGSQPVHGPDAFEPAGNGAFTRRGATAFACGHSFQATAFVGDAAVATSAIV